MPDHRSEKARLYRPWYNSTAWRKIRLHQLAQEPLCRMCKAEGRITVATVCDHIKPHRGEWSRFFDYQNVQSLCAHCHNSVAQRLEKSGTIKAETGLDGWPIPFSAAVEDIIKKKSGRP